MKNVIKEEYISEDSLRKQKNLKIAKILDLAGHTGFSDKIKKEPLLEIKVSKPQVPYYGTVEQILEKNPRLNADKLKLALKIRESLMLLTVGNNERLIDEVTAKQILDVQHIHQ